MYLGCLESVCRLLHWEGECLFRVYSGQLGQDWELCTGEGSLVCPVGLAVRVGCSLPTCGWEAVGAESYDSGGLWMFPPAF